jgi:hypothetical protein
MTVSDDTFLQQIAASLSGSSSTYSGSERHRPPEPGENVDYRVMRMSVEGKAWVRGYAIFWVVFDASGTPTRWGETPCFPLGATHASFIDCFRIYHQAIHKPILDWVSGRSVEDPIIKRWG